MRTKIDTHALLISVLKEHKKSLDLISTNLEEQLDRLTDALARLEAVTAEAGGMKLKRRLLGRRE